MGLIVRLILFPILFVRRILWPMLKGFLKAPLGVLKFFLKSSLLIYIIAFVILYFAIQSWTQGGKPPVTPPPATMEQKSPTLRKKVTQIPPFKNPIGDGNSPFAKKLWGKMTKGERELYSQEFAYAMYYAPAGEPHLFASMGNVLFGEIRAGIPYRTKTGTICRTFEEVVSYQDEAQKLRGKSCQRANGKGWCKLGMESAPNCELGYSEGTWGSMKRTFRRWF